MRVLLDTHIALWALLDSEKLPEQARAFLKNDDSLATFSIVSAWEVAIKHTSHPDKMPISGGEFWNYCMKAGYLPLSLFEEHIHALETLHRAESAPPHKDPFDRMLIAQAKAENMLFLTHDSLLTHYNEPCVIKV